MTVNEHTTIEFEGWAVLWRQPLSGASATLAMGFKDAAEAEAFAQEKRLGFGQVLYVGPASDLLQRCLAEPAR